jgi:hypothetical protein
VLSKDGLPFRSPDNQCDENLPKKHFYRIYRELMRRPTIHAAAALFLCLAALTPLAAQTPLPEFHIAVVPSIVIVAPGDVVSLTVTVTCNAASLAAVADCSARPNFDFSFSGLPAGVAAQAAAGRVGPNTIVVSASSAAKVGSFPIQVTVAAGDTTEVQSINVNVRAPTPATTPAAVIAPAVVAPSVAVQSTLGVHWEHHVAVAKTAEELDRMADELGQQSWELVSVVTRENHGAAEWVGFFRRPKR